MIHDRIIIKDVKNISSLIVDFKFPESKILVITGRNGIGKTSLIKSFGLVSDPQIFQKSSGISAIKETSDIKFKIEGFTPFTFYFNNRLGVLDTRDSLPPREAIIAELSIPYGERFRQFSLISGYDREIRDNIAASEYERAEELIKFLKSIYDTDKFNELQVTKIKKYLFYFILLDNDYYIREDHFSSGEFFLIQLFRLITSGAKLILIDELDVALDASAQVKLFAAVKPILQEHDTRLIVVSHSLAFMNTVDDGGLYYLEKNSAEVTLEQRSFGYIKSDLYGFLGKDRYILTEDEVLSGFLKYLIRRHISQFFEYEVIAVGGEPQIIMMAEKNKSHQIFSKPENVIVVVDGDIFDQVNDKLKTGVYRSPVDDIELFIWRNKNDLLPDVFLDFFTPAKKDKDTAKTYWKKVIASGQKTADEMYEIIERENSVLTYELIDTLSKHLNLP